MGHCAISSPQDYPDHLVLVEFVLVHSDEIGSESEVHNLVTSCMSVSGVEKSRACKAPNLRLRIAFVLPPAVT